MNSEKVIIFDLDGTLLNTLDDLTDCVNYMLEKYGFSPRSRSDIRRFLGNGARNLIERSLDGGLDGDDFERFLEEYKAYYEQNSGIKTAPYDNLVDLIGRLRKRGFKIAVVSNKPDGAVQSLCELYFPGLVDFAVGDRADICRKPSADPVLLAMKTLVCDEAVCIGDSEVDIHTAKNAGVPCVCVTWGFRDKDELIECGADYLADSADGLEAILLDVLTKTGERTE